jgi:hypothetical protein
MAAPRQLTIINEIQQLLKAINQAWLEGHPEKLNQFFHDQIRIVTPDFQVRGQGKAACVQSYADFILQAKVTEYRETAPEIQVGGSTAMAWYAFEIAWEMGGKSFREGGRDFFILTRENDQWLAVWRMVWPAAEMP